MSDDQKNEAHQRNEQVEDLMRAISEALQNSKLPNSVKDIVAEELNHLKAFTLDARPARIAIVGRRGAGKSSLINAIFGEERAQIGDVKAQTGAGKWYTYEADLGSLEILDTRGLGEADRPDEAFSQATALEEVRTSIKEKCPDAILFLSKAKEVSARIDEDLAQLRDLKQTIHAEHAYDVPIISAVTQVDELSPKKPDTPPFDHPVKQQNIAEAAAILTSKLSDAVTEPVKVIPLCSYLEFENGEIVYDIRWNIDTLLDYLIEQLPNEAQIILAKLSKIRSVQKKIARRIGASIAGMSGIVGANPIPLSDLPVITGMQTVMVTIIALLSGKKIDRKGVLEFFGALGVNVAAGFALRQVARQLVKFVPVAGNVVSGAVASAGTYALCEAAIAYFIDDEPIARVKETYRKVFSRVRKEKKDQ